MLLSLRGKILKLGPSCLFQCSPNSSLLIKGTLHLLHGCILTLMILTGKGNSLVWALTAMDLLGFQICTGYKRSEMLMIDNKQYSTNYIPQSNKESVML